MLVLWKRLFLSLASCVSFVEERLFLSLASCVSFVEETVSGTGFLC